MLGASKGFRRTKAQILRITNKIVDGIKKEEIEIIAEEIMINFQSASPNQVAFIAGGTRISGYKIIHINDGIHYLSAKDGDHVKVNGELYRVIDDDNRPEVNYDWAMAERLDEKRVKHD